MAKRASKSSTIASATNRVHLSLVPVGHRARLLDGSIVLVAATINGNVFVRDNDGVGRGPYELPRETVVLEVMAPETRYTTAGEVVDPVSR